MKKFRRIRRSRGSFGRKIGRRASPGVSQGSLFQIDAMAYGALRAPISQASAKYIPGFAGEYTDNIVMALLSYMAAKKGSGMIRNIGLKGLVVENAMLGSDLGQKFIPSIGGTASTQTGYIPV